MTAIFAMDTTGVTIDTPESDSFISPSVCADTLPAAPDPRVVNTSPREPSANLNHRDCIPGMRSLPQSSVDLIVTSIPFEELFTYSGKLEDVGNNGSTIDIKSGRFALNLRFVIDAMLHALRPGCNACIHIQQLLAYKVQHGFMGRRDFRGAVIDLFRAGEFNFVGEFCIPKNPQIIAQRLSLHSLQFKTGKARTATKLAPCFNDYVLIFQKPGDTPNPVQCLIDLRENPDGWVTTNEWVKWASGVWDDIQETDVLDGWRSAREHDEEKHVCLARGSLVLTRGGGYIPIQEVNVGDQVLTHRGRWRPVLAVQKTGVHPVLEVRAQGVPGLKLTPNHKLWTRPVGRVPGPRKRAESAEPEWVSAVNTSGSYVNLKLPPVEESQHTAREWWIVGRWLADGHTDKRTNSHISCGYHKLPELLEMLGENAGNPRENPTAAQVPLKKLGRKLRDTLILCGHGAGEKHLPPEAFTLSPELAKSLLDGYLSGDGHYNESRDRWSASSVSRELLMGLAFVIQRATGMVASVYAGRPAGTTTIEGREVNTRQDWVLSFNANKLGFAIVTEDGAWKRVQSVESSGTVETWNLRVEEDESYTAEGCIVKNCPLQLSLIQRLVRLYTNPISIQPDVTVLDPFMGIGSTAYVCLGGHTNDGVLPTDVEHDFRGDQRRNVVGFELKDSYFGQSLRNVEKVRKLTAEDGSPQTRFQFAD